MSMSCFLHVLNGKNLIDKVALGSRLGIGLLRYTSPMLRPAFASITAAFMLVGCATDPTGASFVTVPHARYDEAFDLACTVARAEGLVPEISDRRTGTIETKPRLAGSVMEPWEWTDLTTGDVVEGTLALERRRARFEFVPTGFRPEPPQGTVPLAGPVLPGSSRGEGADVEKLTVDLELRVTVSVERQFRPGFQRSSWTCSLGSFYKDVSIVDDPRAPRDLSMWTAVARDERFERLLIDRIAQQLVVAK